MLIRNSMLGLVAVLALSSAACGDDDKDDNKTSGTGGDAGGQNTGSTEGDNTGDNNNTGSGSGGAAVGDLTKPRTTKCAGTFEKVDLGKLYDSASAGGKCIAVKDIEEICTNDPGTTAKENGTACYLANSMDNAKVVQCVVDAVKKEHPDVDDACVGCFGDSVACSASKCRGDCALDAASAACTQCRIKQGCRGAFFTCTGLVNVDDL